VCPEGCLCVFVGFFRRERLKIKLGVETNGRLGKAPDGRKVVGPSGKTHALIHAVDAKPLELIVRANEEIMSGTLIRVEQPVGLPSVPENLGPKPRLVPGGAFKIQSGTREISRELALRPKWSQCFGCRSQNGRAILTFRAHATWSTRGPRFASRGVPRHDRGRSLKPREFCSLQSARSVAEMPIRLIRVRHW